MKWSAVQRWTRRENRPIIELICAENPNNYFISIWCRSLGRQAGFLSVRAASENSIRSD